VVEEWWKTGDKWWETHGKWPIEIDGLPIDSMVDFPWQSVKLPRMVDLFFLEDMD